MKIIDNWDYLRGKLDFSDPSMFYMVQLQQRKKDDETFPANNRTVKTFFIGSLQEYDALESEIKRLSDETKSRVYIRLNRRSYEHVALQVNKDLAQLLQDKNFQHLKNLVPSAAGNVCSEKKEDRLWLIDVDTDDKDNWVTLESRIVQWFATFYRVNLIKFGVPTVHGIHLITYKFDSEAFERAFPDVAIHKDNPTLLYFKHE